MAQEGIEMPRRGRTEKQIIATLRQADSVVAVKEVHRSRCGWFVRTLA